MTIARCQIPGGGLPGIGGNVIAIGPQIAKTAKGKAVRNPLIGQFRLGSALDVARQQPNEHMVQLLKCIE